MFRSELGKTLHDRARLLLQKEQSAKARTHLETAVRELKEAVKLQPGEAAYRQALATYRWALVDALLELKDHAVIARVGADLAHDAGKQSQNHRVAALLARCVSLAAEDKALDESKRKDLAGSYSAKALDLLRQAVNAGFTDADYLKTTDAFQPLRSSEEFKKLLSDLETKTGKK
jgi:hypothetical protein